MCGRVCLVGFASPTTNLGVCLSPVPPCQPLPSLPPLPLSSPSLESFCCLFLSLVLASPILWSFSSSLLCVDTSPLFLAFLALSSLPLPAYSQTHTPRLPIFSQAPGCNLLLGDVCWVSGFSPGICQLSLPHTPPPGSALFSVADSSCT